MKICLLTYRGNPYCGGQGVYVSYLGRELARRGHEVHCISGPPYPLPIEGVTTHEIDGGLGLQLDAAAYTPHHGPLARFRPLNFLETCAHAIGHFPEMTLFSIRAFLSVRKLLERHRFDIVHDNQSLGWGLLPLKALGVPLVATIHHPLTIDRMRGFEPPTSFRTQFQRTVFYPMNMQQFVARRIDRLVTVSKISAQEITAGFGVPSERIQVVYNGMDCELFRPRPEIPKVPGRVLYVGNLEDANKGGVYMLRAMGKLLARERPPSKDGSVSKGRAVSKDRAVSKNNGTGGTHLMVVCGGVTQWDWLNNLIDTHGLRGRIEFKFKLTTEELVETYASAEVAVSPSVFEGFGFPAAEAMACGLPLVAARGGALPEVVGDAGILVPARDSDALAIGIGELLADPERRARLGKMARERVLREFQWDETARQMERFYEDAIDAHHRL